MIIEVKVFSSLRRYIPNSERRVDRDKWDVEDGASIEQVLKMLDLPDEEVRVLLINGRNAKKESILQEGDVLHVFPPMAGG
jgi:molybdopterin synthase sulfur carrier subunit